MGGYMVKSAYAAIHDNTAINNSGDSSLMWKKLWNLKVPLKVKYFVWRAVTNVLPTKDQLAVRRVPVITTCPVCNNEIESVYHLLVSCPFAGLCWSSFNLLSMDDDQLSFSVWLSTIFQKHKTREAEDVVMICWSLWKNRNEIVWNQRGKDYSEVCRSAKLFLNQWKCAQDKSFGNFLGFMTQEDGKEHWEHPQEGTVKVNVDATIFENSGSYYVSMVARNHKGDLVEASSSCRYGHIVPELAEAVGIKEALSWIKDRFIQPIVVETDCLSIVQAIRCSSINLSYPGRVVEECKLLLSELKIRHVTLNFIKQSTNKVAHFLARHNSSIADRT